MSALTREAATAPPAVGGAQCAGAACEERRWRRSAAIPGEESRRAGGLLLTPLLLLLRLYQRGISPFLPPLCRFYPTCSQYAVEALRARGPAHGILLATWRLLRCNPFCRGGFDPVPPRRRG